MRALRTNIAVSSGGCRPAGWGIILTEIPLAHAEVALVLRLDPGAQVAAHLLRPHCEHAIELTPTPPMVSARRAGMERGGGRTRRMPSSLPPRSMSAPDTVEMRDFAGSKASCRRCEAVDSVERGLHMAPHERGGTSCQTPGLQCDVPLYVPVPAVGCIELARGAQQ